MVFITKLSITGAYEVRCIAWRMGPFGQWELQNWLVGWRKTHRTAHQLARSIAEPIFVDPCNA